MSISKPSELKGMQAVSEAVALTLLEMRNHARPGMTTKELDNYGAKILQRFGARSAPYETYKFPGWTCISVNEEIAHGIPSDNCVLQEGDLINIDVSAELNGFWSDNGGSFVLGRDLHGHQDLVEASKAILRKALEEVRSGMKISYLGKIIESEAKKRGYKVIKNLAGHGIGRSLHEEPHEILNYPDRLNHKRFKKNSVVAIETFIASNSTIALEQNDGWTLKGNRGGFTCQHEHTLVIGDGAPLVLTEANGILD